MAKGTSKAQFPQDGNGERKAAAIVLAKQLEALRGLAWWFPNARPIRFEAVGELPLLAEQEQEMVKAHLEAALEVRKAKRKLLATGFDVPDSWLKPNPVGSIHSAGTRLDEPKTVEDIAKSKWKKVLTWDIADRVAVEKVGEEMSVAILRLEAELDRLPPSTPQPEADGGKGRPGKRPMTPYRRAACVKHAREYQEFLELYKVKNHGSKSGARKVFAKSKELKTAESNTMIRAGTPDKPGKRRGQKHRG